MSKIITLITLALITLASSLASAKCVKIVEVHHSGFWVFKGKHIDMSGKLFCKNAKGKLMPIPDLSMRVKNGSSLAVARGTILVAMSEGLSTIKFCSASATKRKCGSFRAAVPPSK